MRHEQIAEIFSCLARQLCRHVVDAAHEHAIAAEALVVRMILGVVQAERTVYGCAFLHELDRATWVGRNVAYAHEAVRQRRTAWTRGQPGLRDWL